MSPSENAKIRWEEMFPDELAEAIDRCPVCYAAYGLAEPHGVYNAIGLDWLKACGIVERAARAHGGVVAPPFAWHLSERPEFDWFGKKGVTGQNFASAIPSDLFYHLVLYQIRAFDARGFHAVVLVTGHYGGLENDLRLLCEHYTRRTGSPLRLCAFANWELIGDEHKDYRGDHAGVCETSQLMYLRPELVDLSRTAETLPFGSFCGVAFPDKKGYSPSRELGERIVVSQVKRLGELQREMLDAHTPVDGWRAPSLTDVEALWTRFERMTRKYWWSSLTLDEHSGGQRPPFPGWEALGE